MPLSLKDAVYQVRSKIGELNEFNWSNYQIIADLNYAAREMCSIAQTLTREQQVVLQANPTTGTQEVALDVEIDEIKACKYFSGQLFDLEYGDWKQLQTGASTGSIPLYYYTKVGTRQLTPQSQATSNILNIPIGPETPLGDEYYTVLGVWPIPPQPATVSVWYSYFHTWMTDPTDPCVIPSRFLWPWACAAIAKCKRIEMAIGEAQEYEAIFEKGKEEYRMYACRQKKGESPARYGTEQQPWRRNASSSVIFVDPFPLM